MKIRKYIFLCSIFLTFQEHCGAQDSSEFRVYPAVKLTNSFAFDYGSDLIMTGLQFYPRSYQDVAWMPAIGVNYLKYTNIDGYHDDAYSVELRQLFNGRIEPVLDVRLQGVGGFLLKVYKHKLYSEPLVGFLGGLGFSAWRIDGSLDAGFYKYGNDFYLTVQCGLGYVFSGQKKLFNPEGSDPHTRLIQRPFKHSITVNWLRMGPLYAGGNIQYLLRNNSVISFVPGISFTSYGSTFGGEYVNRGNSLEACAFFEYKPWKQVYTRIGGLFGVEKAETFFTEYRPVTGILTGIGTEIDNFHLTVEGGFANYSALQRAIIRAGAGFSF